ncbi:hypothetical protein BS50DRAFT_569490 [Corynespora cassiicola Philippines]|uniref:BTB domain-containing protein n=1 Tax=Corynespora cassiicola Philippines TaxID=1448308 RepID=A0A2T2P2J2_CORCC|nr:hypothetical protein BS50DRAFT_569490 [Corynespora cassiicola Philippines]
MTSDASVDDYRYLESLVDLGISNASDTTDPGGSSCDAPPLPNPAHDKLIVTVGHGITQRTWFLQRALLVQNSDFFRSYLTSPATQPKADISLPNHDPGTFADLVSFMHSNIYSPNTVPAGYEEVRAHTRAYIMGRNLGVKRFWTTAMRSLHVLFEAASLMYGSNAGTSPINAADVAFACDETASTDSLRRLFFDAVASHWTSLEIFNIGQAIMRPNGIIDAGEGERWLEIYNEYVDFRMVLAASAHLRFEARKRCLKNVDQYLLERPLFDAFGDGDSVQSGNETNDIDQHQEAIHTSSWLGRRALPLLPRRGSFTRSWSRFQEDTQGVSAGGNDGASDHGSSGATGDEDVHMDDA